MLLIRIADITHLKADVIESEKLLEQIDHLRAEEERFRKNV